jgi:hypothetical protein
MEGTPNPFCTDSGAEIRHRTLIGEEIQCGRHSSATRACNDQDIPRAIEVRKKRNGAVTLMGLACLGIDAEFILIGCGRELIFRVRNIEGGIELPMQSQVALKHLDPRVRLTIS